MRDPKATLSHTHVLLSDWMKTAPTTTLESLLGLAN